MTQIRHLSRAPISEAIVDFRVKAANDFKVQDLQSLVDSLSDRFPSVEERRGGQVTIGFKPGLPEISTEDFGLQGYFLKSPDEKLIAQFRVDGFTLNKLAPYSSWAELSTLARELWNRYWAVATPQTVTRLALRYINHINLPWPKFDYDDYLRAGPNIPAELPQFVAGFHTQVVISHRELDMLANVVQRYEGSQAQQTNRVILDIDAFKSVALAPYDERIVEIFEQLRSFKNMIFFNFLTESALRSFE